MVVRVYKTAQTENIIIQQIILAAIVIQLVHYVNIIYRL